MPLLVRKCPLCDGEWLLDYRYGRPKFYCLSCQPPGWKVVRLANRVTLRRLVPYTRKENEEHDDENPLPMARSSRSVAVLPLRSQAPSPPTTSPKRSPASRWRLGSCAERLSRVQWRSQACPGCVFDGLDGSPGLVEAGARWAGHRRRLSGQSRRFGGPGTVDAQATPSPRHSRLLSAVLRRWTVWCGTSPPPWPLSAGVWQETAPWCDGQPGQRPIAVDLAEKAANRIEGEVAVAIYASSTKLFALAQSKAKAVVAEVAALPPLPDPIFQSPDPAGDLARHKEHRGTWGVLVGAAQDLEACHAIGSLVADHLGYGPDNLEEGAPRHALVFRNWRPQLSDQRYPLLKPELRLPYAVREGWLPGLWTPAGREDFAGRPDIRRTFSEYRCRSRCHLRLRRNVTSAAAWSLPAAADRRPVRLFFFLSAPKTRPAPEQSTPAGPCPRGRCSFRLAATSPAARISGHPSLRRRAVVLSAGVLCRSGMSSA